jgi:uncharacterized RDD family membrane protein YckC
MTVPNDPNNPNQPPGYPRPSGPPTGPPPAYQQPPSYSPPPPQGQGFPAAPPVQPEYGYGQVSAPPGMYVDPASGLVLPNGTTLATPGRRIGAYFLAIPLFIVTLGIGYIIWGLVLWGRGQTPALKVLKMRVWRPEELKPPGFGYMALREIIGRIVDGILSIITAVISFVLMLTGKERKTLHDMVAGTVVLYDPNKVIPGA